MRKRFLSVLMCAVMISLSCTAFAEEAVKVYTLSLQDSINMVLQKNPVFEAAEVKIKDAERQLEQMKKNHKDAQKFAARVSSGISGILLQRGYYVEQAQMAVKSAQMEKQQKIADTSYSVTQQYYGVKLSERLFNSAENAYKLALENKNAMDIQFSLGLVSELDINNAKYSLNQARATRDKYKRSLELSRKSFAANIYIDEENIILNLTDDIEFEEFSANLSEDTEKALETRYDITMLYESLKLSESMRQAAKLYGISSSEYSSANQSWVQSEVTYKNTKRLIAVLINSSYNAILDANDALSLAEEKLALRNQEYKVGLLQYELGMITNTQLTGIMNNAAAAQTELENAKLTYKLAVEKYSYDIEIGLSQQ